MFGLETCLKGENLCNCVNLWEEEEPGYLNFKRPNGVEMVATLRVPVTPLHHMLILHIKIIITLASVLFLNQVCSHRHHHNILYHHHQFYMFCHHKHHEHYYMQ